MAAEHHRLNVPDGNIERLGQKRPVARGVEHAGHADHALARKSGDLLGDPAHHVERIGHDDNDRLGTMLFDLLRHLLDDIGVGANEVVATHPRLARDAGGDDDHLRSGNRSVVVRAHHAGIEALDGRRFPLVEAFALRDALDDIDEDDSAGEFFFGKALSGGGTDIPGANDGDFGEHGAGKLMSMW